MVQISYSGANGCFFSFPEYSLPPSAQSDALAFFLSLLGKNKMLTHHNRNDGGMHGWMHYGCRFGNIPFSLDYDQYWDLVHFSADSREHARTVAEQLKAMIEAEAAKKG